MISVRLFLHKYVINLVLTWCSMVQRYAKHELVECNVNWTVFPWYVFTDTFSDLTHDVVDVFCVYFKMMKQMLFILVLARVNVLLS